MYSSSTAGKIVGALLLFQMVAGIWINFSLLQPLNGEPGFMVTGAVNSSRFGLTALLALASSSVNLLIATVGFRIFGKHNPLLAVIALLFPCISLALTAVEYTHIMELVSYIQHYQAATAEAKATFEIFNPVLASSRSWSHLMAIGFSGFSLLLFYLMLFRSAQIPRPLIGFGLLATVLQVYAVAQPFIGNNIPNLMLTPLVAAQLMLPVYFIVKGLSLRSNLAEQGQVI